MITNIDKLVALIECLDYRDIKTETDYTLSTIQTTYKFHGIVLVQINYTRAESNSFKLNDRYLTEVEGMRIVYSLRQVIDRGEEIEKESTIKQAINKLRKALKV